MGSERMTNTSVVGIVTRDRETSLAACLENYLLNCRQHGSGRDENGLTDVDDDPRLFTICS